MSMTFLDLQADVKTRSIRDQGGTTFDNTIKNAINFSLFRISRDFNWNVLRRTTILSTDAAYTTGTGAVSATNGSNSFTVTGATFLTNGIKVGRRVEIGGSQQPYIIDSITSETVFTTNLNYDGTTSTTQSYSIYGTEEYNLPIQCDRVRLIWHEGYGYPFLMYATNVFDFYSSGFNVNTANVPLFYRQWNSDDVIRQPNSASVMRI